MKKSPLAGITILDCSTLLPGPAIAKKMLDLGAQVIKIENPDREDPAHSLSERLYTWVNEGKKIVKLDLKKDREKFHRLVRDAHGLIEAFRPSAKERLGLDAKTLQRIQPRLCIMSLSGYSPTDPRGIDRAGHDLNFQARSGMLSLMDGMPGLPFAELLTVQEASLQFALALKEKRGEIVAIDFETHLKKAQRAFVEIYRETDRIPGPGVGLFGGEYPCYRIYKTKDGRRVSFGAVEEKFWIKICEILDLKKHAKDRYATGTRGKKVIQAVQKRLGSRTWAKWEPLFQVGNCCVEPVLNYSEVFDVGIQS